MVWCICAGFWSLLKLVWCCGIFVDLVFVFLDLGWLCCFVCYSVVCLLCFVVLFVTALLVACCFGSFGFSCCGWFWCCSGCLLVVLFVLLC